VGASIWAGYWQGLEFSAPWATWLMQHPVLMWLCIAALAVAAGYVHFRLRRVAANGVAAAMRSLDYDGDILDWLERAFEQNTRTWQPLFGVEPTGWSAATRKRLAQVLGEADSYVQTLNSRFTDPSGHSQRRRARRGNDQEQPAPSRITSGPAAGKPEKPPAEVAGESTVEVGGERARASETVDPPADFVHDDAGGRDSLVIGERR
ncbi:MAG: hypothetical protein KAR22_17240, partial [Gammaproteobacteria bacterium]|nr:hypothetical protein [Gammaproteobacteria bacterium]